MKEENSQTADNHWKGHRRSRTSSSSTEYLQLFFHFDPRAADAKEGIAWWSVVKSDEIESRFSEDARRPLSSMSYPSSSALPGSHFFKRLVTVTGHRVVLSFPNR